MMKLYYIGSINLTALAVWTTHIGKYVDTFCLIIYAIVLLWVGLERKHIENIYDRIEELQKQIDDDIRNFQSRDE